MNKKDDNQFTEALQNAESRDAILKQLIRQRRILKVCVLSLIAIISIGYLLYVIMRIEPLPSSIIFICAIGLFQLSQVDTKIKILLSKK